MIGKQTALSSALLFRKMCSLKESKHHCWLIVKHQFHVCTASFAAFADCAPGYEDLRPRKTAWLLDGGLAVSVVYTMNAANEY